MNDLYIYAIRDRLLNYFQQPFIGAHDKQIQAALADVINNQETAHAIAQAPHHFEVWKLGRVSEDGGIFEDRALICTADSLIRRDIRDRTPGDSAISEPMAKVNGEARRLTAE